MPEVVVAAPPARTRGLLLFALKLIVTASAFAFILLRQPFAELGRAVAQISIAAVGVALLVQFVALAVGTLRWRVLLQAYGAAQLPRYRELWKVYLIGHFYNTYLPGAVGGDVMRGVVTRRAFGEAGTPGALAVVFVERALGLAAVMALTACFTGLYAAGRFGPTVIPYSLLALLGIAAFVAALALGRKLAPLAPAPLARILLGLPTLTRIGPFAFAFVLSLTTQSLVAVCGHVLIASLSPATRLSDSFLAMPLAGAAGFFPLTLAGAGARDWVVVTLYEALGVARASAVAAALALLCTSLISAAVGGLLQLVAPIGLERARDS